MPVKPPTMRVEGCHASPHISPASCCDRRCIAPSGVFSPRGARRTASTRSAPCEVRLGSPVLSVACAMGPDSRRRDDGDVLHRRGAATTKAGPCRRNPPMEAKGGRSRQLPAYGHSLPREGHKPRSGAVTLRADGGRGRSRRCSSSTMLGHRLPPRALISAHEPHRRTALGTPAGPLGRKPHWARHLAALATKPGEKCKLAL